MAYSASTTLSSDIYVFGNITIDSGVTLTENGFYMYATNTFDNLGEIKGGNNPNAPGGIGGNGGTGTSLPSSYAGSGGGGGSNGGCGGSGGSTLVSGGTAGCSGGVNTGSPGSTPSAPTMSQTLTNSMFNNIAKYLGSAAGGSSGGSSTVSGAGGVYGVIVRGKVVIAGTINTTGAVGQPGSDGGGGGSGGGVILILYNSSYTAGTYSYSGGLGGTSAGGNGGAGGNGQVITYNSPFTSPPPAKATYYYPLKYNASTTSNAINFNVSIFDYVTSSRTSLSSNQSFTYLPELATPYSLSFKEQQGTQKVYLNTTFILNTTTINSAFTFNSYNDGCIQYFPCLAETPTWTAKPTSWSIIPANEAVINQQSNTSKGEQFDSPNLAVNFANVIKLSYPFTSFYLNLTNNPKVQNSITQTQFKLIASSTVPASPYTRVLNNITGYSEASGSKIPVNFSIVSTYLVNNYNYSNTATAIGNNIQVYAPNSTYQNPVITQATPSVVGTDVGTSSIFYSAINSYCSVNIAPGSPQSYNIYTVNDSGSLYTFTVYRGYSQTLTGTYMEIYGGIDQASAKPMQSFKINSNPYSVPLQNGYPYAFKFFNCTSTVYQTNFSVWGNPITLYLPQNNTVRIPPSANITAACTTNPYQSNQIEIVCNGTDYSKLVKYWTIAVYNITSPLTSSLVANAIINGSSFSYTFAPGRNTSQYNVRILAYTGLPPDYTLTILSYFNSQTFGLLPSVASDSWIAILMILSGVAIGSRSPAMGLIFEVLVIFLLPTLGIAPVPVLVLYGIITLAALGAFIVAKRYVYGT